MHRLVIVDDSKLIRNRIEREYDSSIFNLVGTAADGAAAIKLCERSRPDVVTMDLTMPELDGIRCISHLTEKFPCVKILVITALNDKATGIEALEKGAMGLITKPFSGPELKAALNEIIETEFG